MAAILVIVAGALLVYIVVMLYSSRMFPRKIAQIQSFISAKKYADAKELLEKLPQSRREHPSSLWCEAQINMGHKQFVLAMVNLQDILKMKEYPPGMKESEVHENLAYVYEKTGRSKEALTELNIVNIIEPGSFKINYKIGKMHFEDKNYDQARKHFELALKTESEHADIHYMLGVIAEYRREETKAIGSYNTSVAIDPTFAKSHIRLAHIFLKQMRYDYALEHFIAAKKDDLCYIEALAYEGVCFAKKREYNKALVSLEEAFGLVEKSVNDLYLTVANTLSDIYLAKRDLKKARDTWEEITSIDSNNFSANERLALFSRVFQDGSLQSFFGCSDERFYALAQKVLNRQYLYVDSIIRQHENDFVVVCYQGAFRKSNNKTLIAFYREPKYVDEDYLKDIFVAMKNSHSTHAFILTPFSYTETAEQFASMHPINLLDGDALATVLKGKEIF